MPDYMSKEWRYARHLERNGCRSSIVSVEHLAELEAEIASLHDAGLLDDAIYKGYGEPYFAPRLPRNLPNAKSIIVLSIPQPMICATFHFNDRKMRFVVPPTYYDFYKTDWRIRRILAKAFVPESHRFVRAALPVKLLAVRSGLAQYGRNNITYVPTHGSFHRLMAYYTDYDSPVDNWQDKRLLPLCKTCKACLEACPTGAIRDDRFLIRAEICLTYLTEKSSKHKFPEWVDPSAHNALVGCMRCQRACPYDKNQLDWYEERGEFSEEETQYLLKGKYSGAKAERIEKKLKTVGLDLTIFPRNLEVLLARQRD